MTATQLLNICYDYARLNKLSFDSSNKADYMCKCIEHAEKHPNAKLSERLTDADSAFANR